MGCVLKHNQIVVEEDIDQLGLNEAEREWFWRSILAAPEDRYIDQEILKPIGIRKAFYVESKNNRTNRSGSQRSLR